VFDHIDCPVADYERARAFYDAVLPALGLCCLIARPPSNAGYGRDGHAGFWISTGSRKGLLHFAFAAESRAAVRAFHAAALVAGGVDNGGPGLRTYAPNYYAAYVFDPDGHNVEAVCRRDNE
jgi:catechol 2,3-dioxygenase-like lactoylglutathione lyase family enzyme